MRATASIVCLILFSAAGAGCKGDREKCSQAAQRFAELVYWDRENASIAKLPVAEQAAVRKRKVIEFNRELDTQLDFRIQQCVAANNDDQADCIIAAKTAAEALDCADVAKSE
jgi:hypothetical protein